MGIQRNGNCCWLAVALVALFGVGCRDSDPGAVSGGGANSSAQALEAPEPRRSGGVVASLSPSGPWIEFVRYADTGVVEAYFLSGDESVDDGRFRVAIPSFGIIVSLPDKGESTIKMQAVGRGDTGEKQGDTSFFFGQSDGLKGTEDSIATRISALRLGDKEFEEVEFAL